MINVVSEVEIPFTYAGKVYVRPIGRGVVLEDLSDSTYLEEILPEGTHRWRITIEDLDHGEPQWSLDEATAANVEHDKPLLERPSQHRTATTLGNEGVTSRQLPADKGHGRRSSLRRVENDVGWLVRAAKAILDHFDLPDPDHAEDGDR